MRYIKQFLYIMIISFIGEVLNYFLPLPIPASIYGIIILFLCLNFQVIKLEDVEDTGKFLIEIMPIMFVPAAVGLMNSWNLIQSSLLEYLVLIFITTIIVMVVSGKVTQFFIRKDDMK